MFYKKRYRHITLSLLIVSMVIVLAAIANALLGQGALQSKAERSQFSQLVSRNCNFYYSASFDVRCYTHRTHGGDGIFTLPLALITHKHEQNRSLRHLVVIVPGGPGQGDTSGAEEISYWVEWLESRKLTFDVMLYDPRGTGSDGWSCESYKKTIEEVVSRDIELEDELRLLSQHLRQCFVAYDHYIRKKLISKGKPEQGLEAFSSILQANDINEIVSGLGYHNVHLWGTSYGTRLALIAAKYDRVKSLILDSPYGFEHGYYSEWPSLYHHSLVLHEKIYARMFPESMQNYRHLFRHVQARLDIQGVLVTAIHWGDDRKIPFLLNKRRLLELSFSVLYNPDLYSFFYRGLEAFLQSNTVSADLQHVMNNFVTNAFDKSFNYMAYFATECLDNALESEEIVHRAIAQYPDLESYFKTEWRYNACNLFDFSTAERVHSIPYTEKPTLIFSGEFDPITQVAWARTLDKNMPNSRYVIAPNSGHGVLSDMNCNWQFLEDFLQKSDVNVDISCEHRSLWP